MPFQNYVQLSRLDQAFSGVPFVSGSTSIAADFSGLEVAYEGVPFSGTIGNVLDPSSASGVLSCRVHGIHMYHPTNSYRVEAAAAALSAAAAVESVGAMILLADQLVFSEFYGYDPRITPEVEYYSDFLGLDFAFNGEPLCQVPVNDVMDLMTLDYFYQGQPLSGATGPKDRIVHESPGVCAILFVDAGLTARTPACVALGAVEIAVGAISPITVPGIAGEMPLAGSCLQVGWANWVYVTGAAGHAPVSMAATLWRGSFTFPVAQAVLQGAVAGIHIPSSQVASVAGSVAISGISDISPAYKGVIAEPAVLSLSATQTITIIIKQLPVFSIDAHTVLALHFDGDFSDSSQFGHVPTVHTDVNMAYPANSDRPGVFDRAGEFLGNYDYGALTDNPNCVHYPDSSAFNFLTGDFNISFRWKITQSAQIYNQSSQYTIMSQLKATWHFDGDPYYPTRGWYTGNGWTLNVLDAGGPRFSLQTVEASGNYYWDRLETIKTVISNTVPENTHIYGPKLLELGRWMSISIGRVGDRGFVSIDGEQQPVSTDFSIDETGVLIDSGTVLSVGAGNPFSSIPFVGTDSDSCLGLLDELIIDKGICRAISNTRPPAFPYSTDPITPVDIGAMFSGTAGVRSFPAMTGAIQRYECILSGDGIDPVVVPLSGFQSRQRITEPSYSEVSLPGLNYVNVVLDRPNGYFSVFMRVVNDADIELQREQLFMSPIESVSISGGRDAQIIVLSGYSQLPLNTSPQTIPIPGIGYISMINGLRTFRTAIPSLQLRTGDIAVHDNEEITVGSITYTLSEVYGTSMEIREG